MPITRDASSPARVTTTNPSGNIESGTTASFSPPADCWLFISMGGNPNAAGLTPTFNTPTNTGTGLTWAQVGSINNASGGAAVVWRAYNASAQSGITVTSTMTWSGVTFAGSGMWVDVWTGCRSTQTGAAAAASTSTTQTNNPSVTTTATGSRVAMTGMDWGATGNPTSPLGDTIDANTVPSQTSHGRAYKPSNSGAPGSVSVNFVNGGSGPINSLVIYEILAPEINTVVAWLTA